MAPQVSLAHSFYGGRAFRQERTRGRFFWGLSTQLVKVRAYSRFPDRHVIRYVTINLNRACVVRLKQIHALSAYNVVGRSERTQGATRWHSITARSLVEGLHTWTPVSTQTTPMLDFGPTQRFIPTRVKTTGNGRGLDREKVKSRFTILRSTINHQFKVRMFVAHFIASCYTFSVAKRRYLPITTDTTQHVCVSPHDAVSCRRKLSPLRVGGYRSAETCLQRPVNLDRLAGSLFLGVSLYKPTD